MSVTAFLTVVMASSRFQADNIDGTDLAAPIFALSVNANVEEEGVVNAGDLSDQIYSMFDASLRNMEMIGKLATGQAYMGERDCKWLTLLRILL